MKPKRKQSSAVSRAGVNFVRGIVEAANCTFQEVDLSNDLGIDAYIEFVSGEEATGCCIAAQIKSGASYVAADGTLVLMADRSHFEYWRSHSLPVCGIVYDGARNRAGWCDISSHLDANPSLVTEGPFRIKIPQAQEFSSGMFANIREHFLRHQSGYSGVEQFGIALERFAADRDGGTRIDALKSLFSFHRNRPAMWCYLASLLRSIDDPDLLGLLVRILCHIPGHGDIFWHKENSLVSEAQDLARSFMRKHFGRDDVVKLLSVVDDAGFERGSIGQCAHALIDLVPEVSAALHSIAFDSALQEGIRYSAIWLFVYHVQGDSAERCLEALKDFRRSLPDGFQDEVLAEMARCLREQGTVSFY